MTLYNQLKTKEAVIGLKTTHEPNFEEVMAMLEKYDNLHTISLYEATTIFWVYYPLDCFCLTRFYDLFKN